ncbi:MULTISPECIES: alanine racemase [unclassified Helicobacter]|uniref:alanine racemase n=1 Tax=unclassified Helicobacter TaxID=2593540 RepID=UPI000CF0C98A|nr:MULTISPECIES: alanine racemase [unclassified Helicobacter]
MAEIFICSKSYKNNLDTIAQHIKSKEKIGIVLKDNAYGHGLLEIATLAHQYGIKSVFVKNEFEARQISHLFQHITVLYGGISDNSIPNIYPTIHSESQLDLIPKNTSIELKVNIGMNRNGINPDHLEEFIQKILDKKLKLFGVFAHNGYSDDKDSSFEDHQEAFRQIKEKVKLLAKKKGFQIPRFHSLNSSGTLRSNNIDDDLVRIGIASYGYLSTDFEIPSARNLKPVASLYADKICTHFLRKGAKIGYSGVTELQEDSYVSTYDIGYGDGLFRFNGKQKKFFTADGFLLLPKTSMDCFSALSTQDRICVFKDARELAEIFHTIPYEILTNLSSFIKRTIV